LVHLWGMSFNRNVNLSLLYELQYLQHIGKFTELLHPLQSILRVNTVIPV
jgi:hypothetical protein